jgi:hypothetical protein
LRFLRAGSHTLKCLRIGVQLETAYNQYIAANTFWSACNQDIYCGVDTDALPEMQTKWTSAGEHVQNAVDGLAALKS